MGKPLPEAKLSCAMHSGVVQIPKLLCVVGEVIVRKFSSHDVTAVFRARTHFQTVKG